MGVELLEQVAAELAERVAALRFGAPVTHVYNPLEYAWPLHRAYLSRFGGGSKEVVLVGMNPGPFGMAQTGVPFGEVAIVRDWFGIDGVVSKPALEHPKRPVDGLACHRSEVSGARLWGWARDRFGTPERFFSRFFVSNYCPLVFLEESGRNRTPDKLPRAELEPLRAACDAALRRTIEILEPRFVVGIGAFAEAQVRRVVAELDCDVALGRVLHPSPASPLANRGWAEACERDLATLGIELD